MAKAKLKRIRKEYEFLAVADLAHRIWREHYAGVISGEQIEYMLEKFQTVPAIKAAEAEGCEYYLVRKLGVNIGYLALQPCYPPGKMFISKLYLLRECRGKGYSRDILGEVVAVSYTHLDVYKRQSPSSVIARAPIQFFLETTASISPMSV